MGRSNEEQSITSAARYIEYIVEKRNLRLPTIPGRCLICYSSHLVERARASFESQVIDIGSRKPVEINFFRPSRGRDFAMVTQQNGASMAVVLLEELIALGFERFISIGTAGHPSADSPPALSIGDVVLADKAHIHEGTSAHYRPAAQVSYPEPGMAGLVRRGLGSSGVPFHEGSIATTDAIYRETPSFIRQLAAQDTLGLDMETSALFTACQFHRKAIAAVLYISDIISAGAPWDLRPLGGTVHRAEMAVFETCMDIIQHEPS